MCDLFLNSHLDLARFFQRTAWKQVLWTQGIGGNPHRRRRRHESHDVFFLISNLLQATPGTIPSFFVTFRDMGKNNYLYTHRELWEHTCQGQARVTHPTLKSTRGPHSRFHDKKLCGCVPGFAVRTCLSLSALSLYHSVSLSLSLSHMDTCIYIYIYIYTYI